jgi:hypothetical protein
MRVTSIAAAVILLLVCSPTARAAAPELEDGVHIYDGSSPLSVNYHSATAVVDWNNDGKKDLLVSQFYYGWVWLFINQGTNSAPVFNGGSLLESNGSAITTSYG